MRMLDKFNKFMNFLLNGDSYFDIIFETLDNYVDQSNDVKQEDNIIKQEEDNIKKEEDNIKIEKAPKANRVDIWNKDDRVKYGNPDNIVRLGIVGKIFVGCIIYLVVYEQDAVLLFLETAIRRL